MRNSPCSKPVKPESSTGGTEYSYLVTHNWRGDVIGIYSGSGVLTAKYEYDTWGKVKSVKDGNGNRITDQNNVGNLNPFRYRGYYYDTESQLYYLMSRYYDPVTHRFINADGYFQAGNAILDANMNAYCGNNPVNRLDSNGNCWLPIYSTCGAQMGSYWMTMQPVPGASYYCNKCGNCDPNYNPSSSSNKNSNVVASQSLPYKGDPNSKDTLYNPDGSIKQERWYGPEGLPERDRDYSHPGNMPFPHDHEWKDGIRGKEHLEPSPEYGFAWDEDIFNRGWNYNFSFNPPMGDKPIWEKAWEDFKRIFS